MKVRARANLGSTTLGRMNKTEARYAALLDAQVLAGTLHAWRYEAIKLRLADNTYYTPDFWLVYPDGACGFDEVKGFWRDDARVKIKVAAEQFPWFRFRAASWSKAMGWQVEDFQDFEERAT